MSVNINSANISSVRFTQQSSNPSSPPSGYWLAFIKSDGLYLKDSTGNVMGPIRGMANSTLWDAAGDLAYGTGADTGTRLGIGTANQILRVNSGATAPEWAGAYTTYTPTVIQNGARTKTVDLAQYIRYGNFCHVAVRCNLTDAGTANNVIQSGNLPIAPTGTDPMVGTYLYYDSGTGFYSGTCLYITAISVIQFYTHGLTNPLGQTPNFAIANGDVLWYNLTYTY